MTKPIKQIDWKKFSIEWWSGEQIEAISEHLAKLRITVFKEFPYLYEGSLEYEMAYTKPYLECPQSLVLLVRRENEVVGASTAIPLFWEHEEIKQPFEESGFSVGEYFYFGESVVLAEWRGQGLGRIFFQEREQWAREQSNCLYACFAAVDRPSTHPLKPKNFKPLNAFWQRQGFKKQEALKAYLEWLDVDKSKPDSKPLTFWIKSLG